MTITKKEDKVEAMLNDMYAEQIVEKYYKREFDDKFTTECYLSLCVYIDKNTGLDFYLEMSRFENPEDCFDDNHINKGIYNTRDNVYYLYITAKRVQFLKDSAIYVVMTCEAIEH